MKPIIKSIFLLLGLFAFAAQQGQAATPPEPLVLAQVKEEARRGNYNLISPENLRDRFQQSRGSLFLVDTRQVWEYQVEHIQGAENLPVKPSWWTQYSPWTRGEMKKFLGADKKRQMIFY